jgi:para-nitrobenzyl esterase
MIAASPVRIASGAVAGTSTAGVRIFRGIPFAAPPLGALRWRPPQPVAPWTGVLDATRHGNDPVQIPEPLAIRRSLAPGYGEDCLTLNLWAPAEPPAGGAPVIVYFDFGGYTAGSASRERVDGTAYAKRGLILVTANYRVGTFGFLAHPGLTAESPQHASGNYGFLDAIAALRWVRDNIAAFGGNPDCVTITGASAGAGTCALLLTSPLTKGLFHRMIYRSGGALHEPRTFAQAEAAGLKLGSDIEALRAAPADAVLAMNKTIEGGRRMLLQQPVLRPIVDGWSLDRDELEAYQSGAFQAVPTIIGNTPDEAYGRLVADIPVKTPAELRAYLTQAFGEHVDEAWKFYGAANDEGVMRGLGDAWSDDLYAYGVRGVAREMAKRQPKTFRYLFAHVGTHTYDPPRHDNDMTYVFGSGDFEPRDRAVSDTMLAMFCRFAETGDPNGPGTPAWTPYDPARDNYLRFEENWREDAGFHTAQVDFLERFYRERKA